MKDVSKTWPFQVHSIIPEKHQQRFCYAALIFILCWLLFCWSTFFSESIKNRSKFLFLDFTKSCPSIQRTYDLDFLWHFMVEQEDLAADKSKKTHENSVFSNPFRAREDQKKAILEQHVTMTTKQEDQRTIGKCLSCLFNSESKLFNLCF